MWGTNKAANFNILGLACILLVGAAPTLMAIVPWDFGNHFGRHRIILRGHSLVVPLIECLIVLIVMAQGFSPFNAVRALPRLSKAGASLFCAVATFGAVTVAKSPILVLVGMFKIGIHALFFLAMVDQIKGWRNDETLRFWFAIAIGLLIYWLIWGTSIWLFDPQGPDWTLFIPGVTHVRGLGFFAFAGFFAGLALAARDGFHGWRSSTVIHGALVSVAALVMVFWTGSRGALIAISSGLAFLLVLNSHVRYCLMRFCGMVFALAIIIALPMPKVSHGYGIERIITSSNPAATGDPSSGRSEMWRQTLKKIESRPLTGWGIEQFSVSGPAKTLGYKQPHNMFLQLLFSVGLLGALGALLAAMPFWRKLKWDMSAPDRLAAWGYLSGATAFGLYDAVFYYPYPVMIFLLAAAMVFRPGQTQAASDRSD